MRKIFCIALPFLLTGPGRADQIAEADALPPHAIAQIQIEVTQPVHQLLYVPDRKTLVVQSYYQKLRILDVETGRELRTLEWPASDGEIGRIMISPDGKTLAAAGHNESCIRLWELATGKELRVIRVKGHEMTAGIHGLGFRVVGFGLSGLAFSPDGKILAAARRKEGVRLWEVNTGKPLPESTIKGEFTDVCFSPDGKSLACTDGVGVLHVVSRASGKEVLSLKCDGTGNLSRVVFSPDSRFLAAVCERTVIVWEATTGKVCRCYGHPEYVTEIAFSPDGHWLASGCWDKLARLWEVRTDSEHLNGDMERLALAGHAGFVDTVAFSPDGKELVTGGWDTVIYRWGIPASP